jgi:pimeloyl-ACP methyl ester carboxylesterase
MAQVANSPLSSIVQGFGPGLLLAHGGGGSIQSNFGALIAPLAKRFTVIGPDYPGSGMTPCQTRPLQLDELADQLVVTAVKAGVRKFAVLGFSLGCAVAIRAAIRHPDRITALILTAGFAQLDMASRVRAQALCQLAERKDRNTLARLLVGSLISEQFLDTMDEQQREGFVEQVALGLPTGIGEQINLVMRADVRGDLPNVHVPTLVIHMAREHLISPRIGRVLSESISGAHEASLDSGHFPIDRSNEWLDLIQDFLATTVGGLTMRSPIQMQTIAS